MSVRVSNIRDVAEYQLCCGCGVCSYLSPELIQIADVPSHGRRPVVAVDSAVDPRSQDAFKACPGIELEHTFDRGAPGLIQELTDAWGPIFELWEGHASDEQIRFAGSSGGAASARALFALEKRDFHGVLHTAARSDVPYLNETVMSHTREDLLKRTGSRYSPASPCDGLQQIESSPGPCLFIGKPCDVAGAQKARKLRPELDAKLGMTIAFFCAGTPSTNGTLEMLKQMGISEPERLISLRYRGNGWPGKATAIYRNNDGSESTTQLTYGQSWGEILQKHRAWRCYLCVDHTGEFADISVGDPWYREVPDDAPGQSLILARTERGMAFLKAAIDEGYLKATRSEPWKLAKSQTGFLKVRGKVWGHLWALRWMGSAAPRYLNLPMARYWWGDLSVVEKFKSIIGTVRRIYQRKLNQRISIEKLKQPSSK